ncbi:hypothetical protein CEXT_249801 [Caerostris extrusa]|uniref:Uncharacterized protein n=1 Tax=Caerostris extrusa TaxID=172846 RepID=A0AAV4RY62_CAEEX|nr:hypothetical protein CEXT_249801 [Caerostris extrusa]
MPIVEMVDMQSLVIYPSANYSPFTIDKTNASLAPFHKWLHHWMGYRQLIGVNTHCDETVIPFRSRIISSSTKQRPSGSVTCR